ncbi:MAG TPA: hypothetical protein ENN41_00510 [Sediminispirochaeta sp.]|nr:hypothetical protein [Sediminispirochaeta sp.]
MIINTNLQQMLVLFALGLIGSAAILPYSAAMVSHFSADIVLHVISPLLTQLLQNSAGGAA